MVTDGEHAAIKVTIAKKIITFFIRYNFGLKNKACININRKQLIFISETALLFK
jgi:hypothetical protein